MGQPTLGEVAYEAYRHDSSGKSLISGHAIPEFAALSPAIQNAWEAAATAVVGMVLGESFAKDQPR